MKSTMTGRVAAAAIAEKYLSMAHGIEIVAFVGSVGHISMEPPALNFDAAPMDETAWLKRWEAWWATLNTVQRSQVDMNEVRCPDAEVAAKIRQRILDAKEAHDSIGGSVVCVIRNLPTGLGEPCFDKFEAMLAHAMLSIPATKGFEIGSGFAGTCIPGHLHNDSFFKKPNGKLGTTTNFSGGIQVWLYFVLVC
jgi:chorismate synthase